MKRNCNYLLLAGLLYLSSLTVAAQNISLQPGESVEVNFNRIRLLEKGTPLVTNRNVSAVAKFSLDATGTLLTVTLQNLSLPASGAMLYALDLGFSKKLALATQGRLVAGNFPRNATWLGPTDNEQVTYGTGNYTIAARDAVLGQMLDFTENQAPLPASFLTAGQPISFSLQLDFDENAKETPLRFRPLAYFLAPDTRATEPKRIRLAVFGQAPANRLR